MLGALHEINTADDRAAALQPAAGVVPAAAAAAAPHYSSGETAAASITNTDGQYATSMTEGWCRMSSPAYSSWLR